MSDRYRALCSACRWRPAGTWQDVIPAARAHEATAGHRVQVSDGGPTISLYPRELWTKEATP